MAYRVQLTRYAVQQIDWRTYGTYRMRVEVTAVEGNGLDPYLFIYQRWPQSPYLEAPCDNFVAIVGPAQLADIPIGEPDPSAAYPFFRLNWIELDFTAQSLAEEVWGIIQRELGNLCQGLELYTQLTAMEEVWVPDQPPSGDSESISSSTSFSA